MPLPVRSYDITILAGNSLSNLVVPNLWVPVSLWVPGTIKGAVLTFKASVGASPLAQVFDGDGEPTTVVIPDLTAEDGVTLVGAVIGMASDRADLESIRWASGFKIRTGTKIAPVLQDVDIVCKLLVKELMLV